MKAQLFIRRKIKVLITLLYKQSMIVHIQSQFQKEKEKLQRFNMDNSLTLNWNKVKLNGFIFVIIQIVLSKY